MTEEVERLRRELRATAAVNRQLQAQLDATSAGGTNRGSTKLRRRVRRVANRLISEAVKRGWMRQPGDDDLLQRLKHRVVRIEKAVNDRTGRKPRGEGSSS